MKYRAFFILEFWARGAWRMAQWIPFAIVTIQAFVLRK